jgi:two-component system LytT family sensor kinase
VRIIAIISGGILFGPWVGIPAGVISGLHRYLIDMDGHTSIPCLIASIIAGLLATWLHLRCRKSRLWLYGILAGMAVRGADHAAYLAADRAPCGGWRSSATSPTR